MKEVTTPSGAILKINPANFADARSLYQAFLLEFKKLKIDKNPNAYQITKDIVCIAMASPAVEICASKCMTRCTYNDARIENRDKIFEPMEAREDYAFVYMEVVLENIAPFLKNLSAQLESVSGLLPTMPSDQA